MDRRPISRRAPLVGAVVAAVVLSFVLPTAATAAPPAAATLVAPADGATTASVTPTLSVVATDPDGGAVDVTFEGREAGATVPGASDADPFTLVVLPDTQNYSYANQAVLDAQLQWVRDSMGTLDTAFVMQVGDLVSEWDIPRHWENISGAFETLDDAAVPYTVLPGNHDFDNVTGDMSVYNSYFPPTRFSAAAWNTADKHYGGYLGASQFGPDPIDRGNADNYALFSAGGTDFLVLNLEWEAPGYALDWADRVLDAHPDRTVILATHSFLTVNGQRMTTPQRSGGTSTAALWEDFVSTHCQIRLVVSGHSNSGDLGEWNRTDDNSCGQPVQQILTDYQSRANGGDGWLRYYTFDPAANTMEATTYSPSLGQFETDADSSFTLPFALTTTQPAPFVPIAARTVTSGTTASAAWSGLGNDTEYEWRAVVDDGTTRTTSPVWTLRTPPVPQTVLAADAFGRSIASGWGSADTGGPWTVTLGSAAPLSVGGGTGHMALIPGQTRMASLNAVSATDTVVDVRVAAGVASSGGAAHSTIIGRQVGSSYYGLNVRFETGGQLRLYLLHGNAALSTQVSTWAPGVPLSARLSVTGTNPTQLAAKVWPSASTEPAAWQLIATSAVAAMQTAGSVAIRSAVSSSSNVATTQLSFDDLRVVSPTATPPANLPPTASFATPSIDQLQVSVDSSASADPDGTIATRAWQFGDGGNATGTTATHTYATGGTYTITLTVTDDDGATASTTRNVTVSAAPPANLPPTASFATPSIDRLQVSVDSSASADPDGTIATRAWQFGDGGTATGTTATHTYATGGTYTITLTVTDDDGATASTTRNVTVNPPEPPAEGVIAADAFERSTPSGWGSADLGGAWTVSAGSSAPLAVSDGVGRITLIPGQTRIATLASVAATDTVTQVQLRSDDAAAGGAVHSTLVGRQVGSSYYGLNVRFETGGLLRVYLLRDNTALRTYVSTWTPGQRLTARLSVTGTSPTQLAANIWPSSSPEPAGWQLTAADSASSMQAAGAVAIRAASSASSTVASTHLVFDDLRVTSASTPPPSNQVPVAMIATPTVDGRAVTVTATGSTDPDGTIASYAWQFGDGATASGSTANHTYGADGSFTITLTVTDDDGATGSTTRQVTVSAAPAPGDTVLASDEFARTASGSWGSADVGGAWTLTGNTSAYSIDGDRGTVTLGAGSTREARLAALSTTHADTTVTVSTDVAAVGGAASATIIGRQVGTGNYALRLRFDPGNVLRVYLLRGESSLGSFVTTWSPGAEYTARLVVTGTSPTQLSASVWAGSVPPAAWQLTASDGNAALQTAGSVALKSSVSSSSSVATTRIRYDDYRVTDPSLP